MPALQSCFSLFFASLMALTESTTFQVQRLQPIEITLTSSRGYSHPLLDVSVQGVFTEPGGRIITIKGFWDGDNTWRIRFAPPAEGIWSYRTESTDRLNPGLHGTKGEITVLPYSGDDPFSNQGWLKASSSGRFLTYEDGSPFFWLGDTAWEMTWKSEPADMLTYMDDRQGKGFNVIQVVALSHQILTSNGVENRMGEWSFNNEDFYRINPRYFDYLDTIVTAANARGMAVALVPLWAAMSEVHKNSYLDDALTADQSLHLAEYIGARYAGYNVIWIVGGDNSYHTHGQQVFWDRFAGSLREASGDVHLMTVHPKGWSASFDYFDNHTDWIDFHMYQSSHLADGDYTFIAARAGYRQKPAKPVLNGEAAYEDIYHNLWEPGDSREVASFRIRPEHIRQANYESILSGALVGMTYGANGVWQWSTQEHTGTHSPRVSVAQAISFPGSSQLAILKSIMTTYDWHSMTPQPHYVVAKTPKNRYIPVAHNRKHLIVFFPKGTSSVVLNAGDFVIDGTYTWINPATGEETRISEPPYGRGPLVLNPPDSDDWVLVLARAETDFFRSTSTMPKQVSLDQNVPNPFNPSTRIRYHLRALSRVRLTIYNTSGELVRLLVNDIQLPGTYSGLWNGLTSTGRQAPSGVYFYQLVTDRGREGKKMLLVR